MADTEFEEFRDHFEALPHHIRAPTQCYTLVHDVVLDDDSPKDDIVSSHILPKAGISTLVSIKDDDEEDDDDEDGENDYGDEEDNKTYNNLTSGHSSLQSQPNSITSIVSDDDILGKITTGNNNKCCNNSDSSSIIQARSSHNHYHRHCHSHQNQENSNQNYFSYNSTSISTEDEESFHNSKNSDGTTWSDRPNISSGNERRRRKLPELPKKRHFYREESELVRSIGPGIGNGLQLCTNICGQNEYSRRQRRKLPDVPKSTNISLAEELGDTILSSQPHMSQCRPQSLLMLKCHSYLRNEDSSPEVDSGNSTAHSPDGPKSTSPQTTLLNGSVTPSSASSSGSLPFTQLELLEATHRGLYKFVPRHRDEIEVEIGDPIYVQKEADDLWCEGVNLRSGQQGVFPSAYVVDVEYNDFDPTTPSVKRERFLLGYLGSVETLCHKGNAVLCQAVKKIVTGTKDHRPHSCILEVSDQGLRMVDKSKPKQSLTTSGSGVPCHDYFYSLKNVSFCGFHPGDHRYLGFITKHPHLQRFACHVFLGCESTRPVAESVGRAFQRFYTKFIETAYPIEDIYIE